MPQMTWAPLSRDDLAQMLSSGLDEFDAAVRAWWDHVKLTPEKWQCSPFGDVGGGFWVVAEIEGQILWYNDIEDGFNLSPYTSRGTIDEYLCNQTSFVEFLQRRANENAEAIWPKLIVGEPPSELLGPGHVQFRQTTYWDLQSNHLDTCRVHFRHKTEHHFSHSCYDRVVLTDAHPVLYDYVEAWEYIDVSSAVPEPRALIASLDEIIDRTSCGWRNFGHYANSGYPILKLLAEGNGQVMWAPTTIAEAVANHLEQSGIRCSRLRAREPRPGYRAMLLGRNFVIAKDFRFESR